MFEHLQPLPADPLLGIMAAYAADPNPQKVDLGVGVYKDDSGNTPIFASVKAAEAQLIANQNSKVYLPPAGPEGFLRLLPRLVFGEASAVLAEQRAAVIQTPGGCGALRVAAEFIRCVRPSARVWLSDPTWANHEPLLGDAGLALGRYPYYDQQRSEVRFDEMMSVLAKVPAGDVVLLHGCCHNPSGADLTRDQWREVSKLAQKNGFLPFVDLAYQGFAEGVDEDAFGIRLLAEELPELIVATSCSKNFGLYRERTGSLCVITENSTQAAAVVTHLNKIVRGIYSMPPAHGASIVETLLGNEALKAQWLQEVGEVRERMKALRKALADALQQRLGNDHFRFIERQRGMFSFLGISAEQIKLMREQFSVYAADSSRISVAGLSNGNVDYVADAIVKVLE